MDLVKGRVISVEDRDEPENAHGDIDDPAVGRLL